MRSNTPITETDTRLIDRNTCVPTLFHTAPPGSAIYVSRLEGVWTANSIEFKWVETISSFALISFRGLPQKSISQLLRGKWFYVYFVNPSSDIGSYELVYDIYFQFYSFTHTRARAHLSAPREEKMSHYYFDLSRVQLFRPIFHSLYFICLNISVIDVAVTSPFPILNISRQSVVQHAVINQLTDDCILGIAHSLKNKLSKIKSMSELPCVFVDPVRIPAQPPRNATQLLKNSFDTADRICEPREFVLPRSERVNRQELTHFSAYKST